MLSAIFPCLLSNYHNATIGPGSVWYPVSVGMSKGIPDDRLTLLFNVGDIAPKLG